MPYIRFKNISSLVLEARTKMNESQVEFAKAIGLGIGQFVSNIERGICPLPLKNYLPLCKHAKIPLEKIITARLEDEKARLEQVLDDK